MRVIFRTDADSQIGTGHLMRCLALAEGLRARGVECMFFCRGAGLGSLARKIADAGHTLHALPEAVVSSTGADLPKLVHANWLPGGWQADAGACRQALKDVPPADWLIVDHYALDSCWEEAMRPVAKKIMVIDDLADRQHDCDFLLDQNQIQGMATRYNGRLPVHCERLLGPRYALLRTEFSREMGSSNGRKRAQSPRLLVMFGGADAQNLSLRTVGILARIGWSGPVDVVAGPLYAELPTLRSVLARLPNTTLHAPAQNVAALMRDADLAIGSPGVASWERCACALPSLTIAQADNQEAIGEALAEAGAHWYLGRADKVQDSDIETALLAWCQNALAREAMRRAAESVCDGRGVGRVVRRMLTDLLSIRPVRQDDAEMLFVWRNDERTRRQSLDPRPLVLASHLDWIEKTLMRTDVSLLLACRNGVPVACVRFDYLENRARISIYTDPALHGGGLGSSALTAAMNWVRTWHPSIAVLEADVLAANQASHTLFLSAGFRPSLTRYELSWEEACLQ